jgi:hypothetical protein
LLGKLQIYLTRLLLQISMGDSGHFIGGDFTGEEGIGELQWNGDENSYFTGRGNTYITDRVKVDATH